jgi:hypothetical protein
MKKIIFCIMFVIMTMGFVGCGDTNYNIDKESRFRSLNIEYRISGGVYRVVVDTENNLVYLSSKSGYDTFPFLDKNGVQYNKEEAMKLLNFYK